MNLSLRDHTDKLALLGAAALLAAGAGWSWRERPVLASVARTPVVPELTGAAHTPANQPTLARKAVNWRKPAAQSGGAESGRGGGPGWVYEVFTPPIVYYNTLARSFSVTPPSYADGGAAAFGLELLDVKRELYRLQLAGYFGGPGDYLAAFVSPLTPETLLGREGRRFEELGLILRSFEVKKIVVDHLDAQPVYDVAAFATVHDEQGGTDVVLDSRSRKHTDTPLAVLRLTLGGAPAPREVHEGDSLSDGIATYRVERIQLDPPEVVVAKHTPGLPFPETVILRPAESRLGGMATKPSAPAVRPGENPRRAVATNR